MSIRHMIVDNRLHSSEEGQAQDQPRRGPDSLRVWRGVAVALLLFALTFSLQILSGAYTSEFAGYPDEPAHYVTSLMVHDYLAQMKPVSPMAFAEDYYAHYPKVAFGHWPPLLYVVQALWMFVFSTGRISVLLELAVLTTLLALSVAYLAERRFGWKAGALAGALLVCLPIIQVYTDEVMAEILLVLVSLWAAVYFARFMDSGKWQDSMWFGIYSSLAILTKGNGWEIGLAPPVALILTRRWRLLSQPAFWLPVAIVGVVCLPWQLLTFEWAHQGWGGGDKPNMAFALEAMVEFLRIMGGFMGPILSAVALLGIVVTVVLPFFRRKVEPDWAVMVSLIFAVWLFHLTVPAGIESRKMIVAVPALILFLFAGGEWLVKRLPGGHGFAPWRAVALTAVLGGAFCFQTFAIPQESHYGFTEAAKFITSSPELRGDTILVSSERDGEGLLISEIAMHEKRPGHTILRASKVLSKADWIGTSYRSFYRRPSEVMDYLTRTGVQLVVVDTFPARMTFAHHGLVMEAIRANPDSWTLLQTFSAHAPLPGVVKVYRFEPAAGRAGY